MYYKLMQNGIVTDVIERKQYVRWQDKHGVIVPCAGECANGILASDGTIYHVDGLPAFPQGDFATAYPIDRAEYLTLADRLGKEVEPLLGDVEILRGKLNEQTERNDMLEECLLEMSEVVYA